MNVTVMAHPACRITDSFLQQPSSYIYNFLVFNLITNSLIAIITSCSNALVIITILKTDSLRTPKNILILGLALWDFGNGMLSLPLLCASQYYNLKNELLNYCIADYIFSCVSWLMSLNSFLTLTAVTADRFLAVHLHLRYIEIVTAKRTYFVLVVVFLLGLCGVVSRIFVPVLPFLILVVISLIFYLSMNAFFIFKVSQVVRRHNAQIHAQQQLSQSNINMPRFKKSVNTMYYVIGAFVLCYIPFIASTVIHALLVKRRTEESLMFAGVSVSLVFFNGVFSPIIYCWKIKELRTAGREVLRRACPCNLAIFSNSN